MNIIDKIVYYWLYITGHLLGALPLAVQYFLSDIIRFFVYRVFHYRVRIVRIHLNRSFPEKTEQEKRVIERDFYKHLVDTMLESLTLISLSEKSVKKRLVYTNPEALNLIAKDRSAIGVMAHFGSWEYTINSSLITSQPVLAVYHPLKSKGFEKFYYTMRSKYGVLPTPMASVGRNIARRNSENIIVALIADQNPPWNKDIHWINFLNQKTLFFRGAEMLATRYNMGIVYISMEKVKRGFYKVTFIPLYNGTETVEPFEITRRYAELLEKDIRQQPHLWLWTHKRWKKQPDGVNIYAK